jgi:hypothetical protein
VTDGEEKAIWAGKVSFNGPLSFGGFQLLVEKPYTGGYRHGTDAEEELCPPG